MKTIIFIIILLLRGISLFASSDTAVHPEFKLPETVAYTGAAEESTAAWERDSESKLYGEKVLSDFRNNRRESFALNALCPPETIEKLLVLRRLTAEIIYRSVGDAEFSSAAKLAAGILVKMDGVSLTPLTLREIKLAASAEISGTCADEYTHSGIGAASLPHPEIVSSPGAAAAYFPEHKKSKITREKRTSFICVSKSIQCRKNLYDSNFADLYRLFFYVKDNSGNAASYRITYNSCTLRFGFSIRFNLTSDYNSISNFTFSMLFDFSNSQFKPCCNSAWNLNTSNTIKVITHSGVPS